MGARQSGRLLATIGIGLAGMVAASCSTADPFSVQKAYGDTLAAKTARESLVLCFLINGKCSPVVSGQGVMDLDGSTFEATANDLHRPLGRLEKVGSYMYQQLLGSDHRPPESIPINKDWVRIDLSKVSDAFVGQSAEPAQLLERLAHGGRDIRSLGARTIDGTPTSGYRIAVTQAPKSDPRAKRTYQFEIWVDAKDHIRRVETDYHFGADNLGDMHQVEDFWDFGVPVAVNPPPSDQTIDAQQVPCFRDLDYGSTSPGAWLSDCPSG